MGIQVVITLKKNVDHVHVPQAIGQLMSSSLKAPLQCYPMSLLTDLNDHCWFLWFNEAHIMAEVSLMYPKNAIDFILAMVSGERRVAFIERPLKRLRVDDFVPLLRDGADEMMERYELMADELDPAFLQERRLEYTQQLIQSMPAYAHLYE